MNAKQRNEYWKKVERLRVSLDSKYSSLIAKEIRKDLDKFSRDVNKFGASAALSLMGAYAWNEEMIKIMEKLYKEAAITFGNASFRAVRVMSQKAANPFGLNDEWIVEMVRFLSVYGFTLVAQMTQTTKAKLQEIVTQAIADGLTNAEIVELIMQEGGYAEMRAKRIARTEVMRSSNYATMKGAEKHNFEVDKIWIARKDFRTRRIPRNSYDHIDLDGKQVAYTEPFISLGKKGDTVTAQFPGDPTTPAGFTINCRCTIAFIPRRDQFGNLILKR